MRNAITIVILCVNTYYALCTTLLVWCVYTGLCDAPSAAERWVVISSVSASRSSFQMQPP